MDKKLFKNFIYNVMYQIVILLSPIIVTPYTTRVLGEDPIGTNAWTSSIVQWFVIFGVMGIAIYGSKAIAAVRDDRKDLSRAFFEIFGLQAILLTISTVIFYIFITVLNINHFLIFAIQGITLISTLFDITWFYIGIEDFKKASIRNILVKIIGIILIFTLVKSPDDLPTFVLINTLTGLFGQLIMWLNLKQHIDFVVPNIKGIFKHFKPNFVLFVPTIAISVYVVLDQTLIGIIADEAQVGFYAQAQRFVKMFLFFVTTIGTVMLPRIANMHSKGESEGINKFIGYTMRIALYLSVPMMFGMIAVGPYFASWFLDKGFESVGYLIAVTAPITLFISLSNVFGIQYMVPLGLNKQYSVSVVVGAVVNFGLNVILIYYYGAYGAAVASVLAELSVTFVQWLYIRKHIQFNVFGHFIRYFIAGLIMCVVVFYIGYNMGASFLTNLVQIFVGATIYFIILTITRDSFHKLVLSKLMSIVFKKQV